MGTLLKLLGGLIGVVLGGVVGLLALLLAAGGNLSEAGPTPLLLATIVWVVAMALGGLFGARLGKRLGQSANESK